MSKRSEINDTIERICQSAEFSAKKKICQFLRFIVDKALSGQTEELKGYFIGINVFDRDNDFDPDHDPIVRIQAGRLRRSLEVYYLSEGKDDKIQIVIPIGSYIPQFIPTGTIENFKPTPFNERYSSFDTKPSIAVLPFKNLTGDPDKEYFVQGFREEISIELTQYEDLIVISCWSLPPKEAQPENSLQELGVHFLLEGSVRLDEQEVTILIKLIDAINNQQIWAERYRGDLSVDNLVKIQEEIARTAARILGSEYGIILQHLSIVSLRKKPRSLDTYDAILRYYQFETDHSQDSALRAFQALEQAIQEDPTCGVAIAMLASLYANIYMLDGPNGAAAKEKLIELADKALMLDPNRQRVRIIYAWKCFVCNEKERFLKEVDTALAMNPNSPLRLGSLGFHLALYGEWERGKALLDQAMNQDIGYPLFLHGATTLYYYRTRNYEHALEEAGKYKVPALFWGPLLRTAVMGQLGQISEARMELKALLELKPDFEKKAGMLISRFVKENQLVEHIIDGLQKVNPHIH